MTTMSIQYFDELYKLLSLELNCAPDDFQKSESVLTVSAKNGGRAYADEKYFFHMATAGANAVITADECLHCFLAEYMKSTEGFKLFELPRLLRLETELNKHGYTLSETYHMFLPRREAAPQKSYPVRWFFDEEIMPFYGDMRFPNAICPQYTPNRPDRIVVCAYDGDSIMGMAGSSQDAVGWQQIGIDVNPEYRSMGVGTYLVTLLKNELLRRGEIPFYGTSISNYHSWNIAINSGFCPAWVEIGAQKLPLCEKPLYEA